LCFNQRLEIALLKSLFSPKNKELDIYFKIK